MKRINDVKAEINEKVERQKSIVGSAENEKRNMKPEEVQEWNKLDEEVRGLNAELQVLIKQEERNRAASTPVDFATPGKTELAPSEVKNIRKASVAKMIRSANIKTGVKLDGIEAELRSVAEQEMRGNGIAIMDGAALIPQLAMRTLSWNDEQREREYRDITTGAALGAELINTVTDRSNYLEALRPYNVLQAGGIEVIQNASGDNVNYPRENSVYTAAMAATENAAATESMTATLFQTVSFTPKRGTGYVQVSNQMSSSGAGQGGSDLEARVRNQIVKGHALLMDTQGISGTGSSGQVTGITTTSGVGTVVGGTNGANFSRTHITSFESTAGAAGAVLERCKYFINFSVNAYGKRTEISSGSGRFLIDSVPIWMYAEKNTGKGNRSMIDQYEALVSSNIPNNLTKGTASGIASAILFGDPTDAKFMQFGGMQVIVDPYVNGGSALTNYYVHHWFDFKVLRPGSWVISLDMLTP